MKWLSILKGTLSARSFWIKAMIFAALASGIWFHGYTKGSHVEVITRLQAERDSWKSAYNAVELERERREVIGKEVKRAAPGNDNLSDNLGAALDCLHKLRNEGGECLPPAAKPAR